MRLFLQIKFTKKTSTIRTFFICRFSFLHMNLNNASFSIALSIVFFFLHALWEFLVLCLWSYHSHIWNVLPLPFYWWKSSPVFKVCHKSQFLHHIPQSRCFFFSELLYSSYLNPYFAIIHLSAFRTQR